MGPPNFHEIWMSEFGGHHGALFKKKNHIYFIPFNMSWHYSLE